MEHLFRWVDRWIEGDHHQRSRLDALPFNTPEKLRKRGFRFVGPTTVYAFMQSSGMVNDGPWALFRLFQQGRLQPGPSSDRYTLTFVLGDRQAAFEIRAGSVLNPFAPGILSGFKCPVL